MAKYSVTMCNLDMVDTLETTLCRLLDQTDERFEFVVVDGGSSDGSVDVLKRLEASYSRLRVEYRSRDPNRSLGEDRNRAFELSEGDYILESLDFDDLYYENVLPDFVTIFEAFVDAAGDEKMLHGRGINAARRSLLVEEYPYRPVSRSEDRDLWRRLFADDKIVWLKHDSVAQTIGYNRSLIDQIKVDIRDKAGDLLTGVTLSSALIWSLSLNHPYILEKRRPLPLTFVKRLYDILTYTYAYWRIRDKKRYAAPTGFEVCGALEQAIKTKQRTIEELEQKYEFTVDREALSDEGRQRFFNG